MAAAEKLTTTLSTKGQVILPKAVRDRRRWSPGTRLTVEETPEGVLLRPAPLFPPTRMEDVFGSLKYDGPPKTIEEMDQAVLEQAAQDGATSSATVKAIDTNLVIRIVTKDDPDQAAQARALVDTSDVFVPTTVLLEAGWVLQKTFGFRREEVAAALANFAGLPRVTLENAELASMALAWTEAGLDFADAIHLAAAQACESFVTFDRTLQRRATALGATVESP